MPIDLVTIVVDEYEPAIRFFVEALGFDLVEDSPSLTNDGRPKRWVVVRPPGGQTGILLARADGERQCAVVGEQVAGRVGFFLRVDDFDAAFERMTSAGVEFVSPPRTEPYGRAWRCSWMSPVTGGTCSARPSIPPEDSSPPSAAAWSPPRSTSPAPAGPDAPYLSPRVTPGPTSLRTPSRARR